MQHNSIQLNDSGTFHLLHHNYREATGCFREALSQMKASIATNDQETRSAPHPIIKHRGSSDLQYEFVDLNFYEGARSGDRCCYPHPEFHNSMVCETAISICEEEGEDSLASTSDSTIALAVIYNLGIATHLWGLQEGSVSKLRHALRYYELAFGLHAQEQRVNGNVCVPDNTINMCVLNNSACIYMAIGDQTEASTILQELSRLLVGEPKTNQNKRKWTACWTNILTLLMGPPKTAGAA